MYLKDNGNLHLLVGRRDCIYVFEKSSYAVPICLTLTHILESRVQNLHILYIYNIYIYPLFSIEQTWKIVKLRMRTEMEEPFYTTLFHFIIT